MFSDARVTFRGAGLDRAAHLRPDDGLLQDLWRDKDARCLAVWRGKILMDVERLGLLPTAHPLFAERHAPVFLGLAGGVAHFALDISDWEPDPAQVPEPGQFLDATRQHHPLAPEGHGFCELRALLAQLSPLEAELAATAKAILTWHDSHGFCARCGSRTDMAMGGWQRLCPACRTPHFPRTDPVVIMLVTRGNKVLLGRSPGWPEGMYSLLAGFMEPGETVEVAVRREVMEEAGVPVGAVRYLASQPWPFPASLMIGCAAEALAFDLTHDPVEIDHVLWVTREEVARIFSGRHPQIRPPRPGAIATYLLSEWLADRTPCVG